jgi:hypothetical protein
MILRLSFGDMLKKVYMLIKSSIDIQLNKLCILQFESIDEQFIIKSGIENA